MFSFSSGSLPTPLSCCFLTISSCREDVLVKQDGKKSLYTTKPKEHTGVCTCVSVRKIFSNLYMSSRDKDFEIKCLKPYIHPFCVSWSKCITGMILFMLRAALRKCFCCLRGTCAVVTTSVK